MHSSKLENLIKFPVDGLDLTNTVLNHDLPLKCLEDTDAILTTVINKQKQIPEDKHKLIYDLYGVVNHSGSVGFGHYTASCKNFKTGQWFEFNDSIVSVIEESDIVSDYAYVLFYERRNSDSYCLNQAHTKQELEILKARKLEKEGIILPKEKEIEMTEMKEFPQKDIEIEIEKKPKK